MTRDGVTIDVQIHKLEDRPGWVLEVINDKDTSTIWNDLFDTDEAARTALLTTEGMATFLDQATVIPFRR